MKNFWLTIGGGVLAAALAVSCIAPFEPDSKTTRSDVRSVTGDNTLFFLSAPTPNNIDLKADDAVASSYPELSITVTPFRYTDWNKVENLSSQSTGAKSVYLDIKADGTVDGVEVWSAKPASGLWEKDRSLPYKASWNGSSRILTLKVNTSVGTSTWYPTGMVIVDPAKITLNGKAGRLSQDGDSKGGEAEEDLYLQYFTFNVAFSGITLGVPSGAVIDKVPMAGVPSISGTTMTTNAKVVTLAGPTQPATDGYLSKDGNMMVLTLSVSGYTASPFNKNLDTSSLTSALELQKYNRGTKTWEPVSFSAVFHNTISNQLELTLGSKSALYDMYRGRINPYFIVEKDAVAGYKHRAGYNESAGFGDWQLMGIAQESGLPTPTFTALTLKEAGGKNYVDVQITEGSLSADTNTVNWTDSAEAFKGKIRAFVTSPTDWTLDSSIPQGTALGGARYEIAAADLTVEKIDRLTFRVSFPPIKKTSLPAKVGGLPSDIVPTGPWGIQPDQRVTTQIADNNAPGYDNHLVTDSGLLNQLSNTGYYQHSMRLGQPFAYKRYTVSGDVDKLEIAIDGAAISWKAATVQKSLLTYGSSSDANENGALILTNYGGGYLTVAQSGTANPFTDYRRLTVVHKTGFASNTPNPWDLGDDRIDLTSYSDSTAQYDILDDSAFSPNTVWIVTGNQAD